jgi:hypothetical protein
MDKVLLDRVVSVGLELLDLRLRVRRESLLALGSLGLLLSNQINAWLCTGTINVFVKVGLMRQYKVITYIHQASNSLKKVRRWCPAN